MCILHTSNNIHSKVRLNTFFDDTLELSSCDFMMLGRENLIQPLVSHQAMSILPDSVRAANKGENDMVICL